MRMFLVVLLALVAYASTQCVQENNCVAADGCRCPSGASPLPTADTPQFIVISFNDAVSDLYYNQYYWPLLDGRTNPDDSPISATFFVPHEYTDYSRVNALYNAGHEIAVHTITKNATIYYWQEATVETLIDEFQGQKEIITAFAGVPAEDITGARVPNFELAGNRYFSALSQSDIGYDATWTLLNNNRLFPFSLDVDTDTSSLIGSAPTEAHPGIWVAPVINLAGEGVECNNLQACRLTGDAAEITEWLTQQFENSYAGNRPPINIVISAAWFMTTPGGYEGLNDFLDSLVGKDDVFVVSSDKVVAWAKNPVPAEEFNSDSGTRDIPCNRLTCGLPMGPEEIRYMVVCTSCPAVYPWLGNPLGLAE